MGVCEVAGVTTHGTVEAYYLELAEGMGRGEAMQAQLKMLRSEEHAHPRTGRRSSSWGLTRRWCFRRERRRSKGHPRLRTEVVARPGARVVVHRRAR